MKPIVEKTYKDYEDFKKDYHAELLLDALAAIQPDYMRMDRQQALTLAGAMKACGCSQQQFADVMSRSTADKGTFAKQWGKFRGSGQHGNCTDATIFDYAIQSGWKWPDPVEYVKNNGSKQPAGRKDAVAPVQQEPTLETMAPWRDDFTISCIIDKQPYKSKPTKAYEIRNREQTPTPQPDPVTLQDFARAITNGCTFSPTVYNKLQTGTDETGKPIFEYKAIMQQVFVVDIDNEEPALDPDGKPIKGKKKRIENPLDIPQAIEICKRNQIAPFFIYETFSSKEHREDPEQPYTKFRLCFATDKPITVQEYGEHGIKQAIAYFIGLFGKAADQKTTDAARLIYGTDEKSSARLYRQIIDSEKLIKRMYVQPDPEQTAAEEEPALEIKTGEEMLADFLQTVANRDFEPIPTGISDLDHALAGGFMRKTLVMLGAAPGMGKTAVAQWIFENMAEHGQDVLYINLEMAREQLLARSLSRIAYKLYREDLSALDVLRGYQWNDKQKETIENAARVYREKIAPRFVYNPEGITNAIDKILMVMDAETLHIKEQGRPAPIICIDYLQLIDTKERDAVEGMKNAIFKLKDYAKKNDTVVFLIMANNRASNKEGVAELESGRDTSAIEYTCDVMLGLSYTAIEDKQKYQCGVDKNGNPKMVEYTLEKIRELKKAAYEQKKRNPQTKVPSVCNEISLKVLKNRFGEAERRANLIFDGKHSTFMLREYRYQGTQYNADPEPQEDATEEWAPIDEFPINGLKTK